MTEEIKPKKATSKKYTALKTLIDFKGNKIVKGEQVTLTTKEAEHFKKSKAI